MNTNNHKPIPDLYQAGLLNGSEAATSFWDVIAEGLIVQNSNGDILICNKSAEIISGLTREQMTDRQFLESHWRCFREDGTLLSWNTFPAAVVLHTGVPQKNVILAVYKATEGLSWMNINSYPLTDPTSGRISMVVTSFTDITVLRQAQQEIQRSEKTWRSVLNHNKSGIFLINQSFHILVANDYGKKLLGFIGDSNNCVEEKNFLDMVPEFRRNIVRDTLLKAFEGKQVEYEVLHKRLDNEDLWLLMHYAPIKSNTGEVTSVCITSSNITSLKMNDAALLQSEQRWKFALDGAGDGVWEYNFKTRATYYSPLYKNMLGFKENEFLNEAYEWQSRLHPDDKNKITNIDALYENCSIDHHAIEYRLKSKSGDYIWVLDRGKIMERDTDGKPLTLIGTHTNITARKLAEEQLIKSEQQFSSFMANTPTFTWIVDEHAVLRYMNMPFLKAFKLTESDIGKSLYEIFPAPMCDVYVENNWKVWNSGSALETIEEGLDPDGRRQLYHVFKFPLESHDGIRLLGGVGLDVTQKALLEHRLADEQEKKKRAIIQANIDAQEKERRELAYELHDNVNQILTSSKLMLEVAAEKPELSNDFVRRSLVYLQQAITEIRKLSHSLVPGTLRDISLEAALDELIQNINESGKLNASFLNEANGASRNLSPDIQLSILRIVQEQFNNILKHSDATEASLSLEMTANRVMVTIRDNGLGFDPSVIKKGLGLNNIVSRTEHYHGTVRLITAPGNGCSLYVDIPV